MIIDALYAHYQALVERPDAGVPKQGFAKVPVTFAFNLSRNGDLLDVIPLANKKGKRWIPVEMEVPEPPKRSGTGVTPSFLCDNSMYIIGNDTKGKPDRSLSAFKASRDLHLQVLGNLDDEGAQAICRFFETWDPANGAHHHAFRTMWEDVLSGGNIVFRLDGSPGYIHERPSIRAAWLKHRFQSSDEIQNGQCLVTGKEAPIARIHPNIKGVRGAQTSGAALVSFNLNAFTSYGKSQNFNAPISEAAAFGYTTVLNHLLSSPKNRLQLDGNTTAVFWSERPDGVREENLMAQLLDFSEEDTDVGSDDGTGSGEDLATTELVRDVMERVRTGRPIDFDAIHVDPDSRFFILGLSPNASRISVRFWQADTFGNMVCRIAQHHADLAIVQPNYETRPFISVRSILRETAPQRDWERVPPLLAGGLMRSILTGLPYPQGLYTAIISRMRADHEVNYVRAAVIKAALTRSQRFRGGNYPGLNQEVKLTVCLDEKNNNRGYRLGRLFAVLERVQQEANPGLNATIRDRYFGAASATPRAVFPQLLRLAQHHVSKATYGGLSDRLIEEILSELDDFPTHLSLEDQGLFMLGYYHQRQAFYQKAESKE